MSCTCVIAPSFNVSRLPRTLPTIISRLESIVYVMTRNQEGQDVESLSDPPARHESPTVSTASTDVESASQIPMLGMKAGILKQPATRSDLLRIDRTGNLIVAGSKSHRICFADEVQDSPRPIAKVHHVDSYKTLNFGEFTGKHGCVCTIS